MKRIRAWLSPVDQWLFGQGSPVSIGVFRILVGFWVFVALAMQLPFFGDWYTEYGYVPVSVGSRYIYEFVDLYGLKVPRVNVLVGVTDPNITLTVFIGTMLAAAATCVGIYSRLSSLLMAIGLVSLHHRNGLILYGADTVIRVSSLYVLLSPSGAAVSLDRLIARRRGKAPEQPPPVSLWSQRLVQLQVAVTYFTSVWHKAGGHHWRDGTATYYPLQLKEFDRFWLPEFVNSRFFVALGTYGTMATQLSMATLVFYRPFRRICILASVAMHLFIEYALNVPLFSFVMISLYVMFYDGEEFVALWEKVKARLHRVEGAVV